MWELFTCGGDIHVQLPYTVINVWRAITMWRGHSRAATVHGNTYILRELRGRAIHMWRGHSRAATVHGNT